MDYIKALEEALGIDASKNMLPLQPGDVLETSAETKALYDVIGFKPDTTVRDGVRNFVDWNRDFYKV
ncbi:nucleoside-diphosphate-sugar epimerase [Citrobacter sp. 506]